ncbi:MAG: hypothetical protein HY390_01550 [Deltaproteobacteria bacterium]|nr:hypothetical protein [Deltaproteobacteria bacterium]
MLNRVYSLFLIPIMASLFFVSSLVCAQDLEEPTPEDELVATVVIPEGYVEPGAFYWTRTYWQWTAHAALNGKLKSVEPNGRQNTTNLVGVVGYKKTWTNAIERAQDGWFLLNDYWSGKDLRYNDQGKQEWKEDNSAFFEGEGETLWGFIKRYFAKPFTDGWDRMLEVADVAKDNWNAMFEDTTPTQTTELTGPNGEKVIVEEVDPSEQPDTTQPSRWFTFGRLGPLGAPLVFLWNNVPTVFQAVWIMGVKYPVKDLALGTTYRTLYPFYPILGTTAYWFISEPLNLALNGSISTLAGGGFLTATGLMLGFDSIKYVAYDAWKSDYPTEVALVQNMQGEYAGLFRLPPAPQIESEIVAILQTSKDQEQIHQRFENLIAKTSPQNQWVVLNHISMKLGQTSLALERQMALGHPQHVNALKLEKTKIDTLKTIYGYSSQSVMKEKIDYAVTAVK